MKSRYLVVKNAKGVEVKCYMLKPHQSADSAISAEKVATPWLHVCAVERDDGYRLSLAPGVRATKFVVSALGFATGIWPESGGSVADEPCKTNRARVRRYLELINGGHVTVDRKYIKSATNTVGYFMFRLSVDEGQHQV